MQQKKQKNLTRKEMVHTQKNEENDNNDLANTQIIVFDNENEKDTRTKQMELNTNIKKRTI